MQFSIKLTLGNALYKLLEYIISRIPLTFNLKKNNYLIQNKGFKSFYREYVNKPLLNPFLSYPEKKNFYSLPVSNLESQLDQKNPEQIQLFEE